MDMDNLNNILATVDYYNHRICTPNWSILEENINFVDITYVIRGQAIYTVNGEKYIVSSGNLLCIPTGSLRSAKSCSEDLMECFSINGIIRDINGNDIALPLPLICNIGLHKDIIALYNELNTVWSIRSPGYILKARAIYLMILQRYFHLIVFDKDTSIIDIRIKKVIHYMSNHFSDPLTVQIMADLVNLSVMYFGYLFKKETGMTFRRFLTSIRMNRAQDMLYSCEYKINEIADACGFSDVFYFSRQFKEHWGYAPSEIIRSRKSINTNKFL